ncbi:MAG: DUF2088 domain-containing protein [Acidobacteria bacterium]|nr:MAG: DUF2088 domain-containing protein [Acidobacteriota bacterium]
MHRRAGRRVSGDPPRPALAWGSRLLPLPPPADRWPRLEAPGLSPLTDPAAALAKAAREAASRAASAAGRRPVALVVPDRTRPCLVDRLVPLLLDALEEEGTDPRRVTIVPASGIHRPMDPAELARWVGPEAVRRGARLAPHDADAPAAGLGTSAHGIAVAAHPAVAGAGAVVAVGRIVFHYLAGFGGGRKLLVPGVADRATVMAAHAFTVTDGRRHDAARPGLLEGNPFHEALEAAAELFPETVFLHVATDGRGRPAAVAAGGRRSHLALCRDYARRHRVVLPRRLEAVVVSAGGSPADRDLVQAHKALDAVAPVVRPGGRILLVAGCEDGVGNPEVAEALKAGGLQAVRRGLRRRFRVGWQTAAALLEKTRRYRVFALTGLPAELARAAGMVPVASLEEGIAALTRPEPEAAAVAPRGASLLYEAASEPKENPCRN